MRNADQSHLFRLTVIITGCKQHKLQAHYNKQVKNWLKIKTTLFLLGNYYAFFVRCLCSDDRRCNALSLGDYQLGYDQEAPY